MVQSQTKPESNRTKSAFFPPLRGTPTLTAASSGGVTSSDLPLSETEEAAPAFALLPPAATTPEEDRKSVV